jgi:hypothetical protein
MKPPIEIYLNEGYCTRDWARSKLFGSSSAAGMIRTPAVGSSGGPDPAEDAPSPSAHYGFSGIKRPCGLNDSASNGS